MSRGFPALLERNHPDYPSYAEHHLRARFPDVALADRAVVGARSAALLDQTDSLPNTDGDVIAIISVGGDELHELGTLLFPAATNAAIHHYRDHVEIALDRLRAAYERPASGRRLLVVIATIADATDGTGVIPPLFADGRCHALRDIPGALTGVALDNTGAYNDAIRSVASSEGALLLDRHSLFLGHGMTAADGDRWLADDCAHGRAEGQHQLRREIWHLLTGELH